MTFEGLSYWAAFLIPLLLLGMTGFLRKLVEGVPFKREHWYLRIDLTVYLLGSGLINLIDLAKVNQVNQRTFASTALLVASSVVLLIVQAGIHQTFMPKAQRSRMQLFMLCGFCNVVGILSLAAFVQLKLRGIV